MIDAGRMEQNLQSLRPFANTGSIRISNLGVTCVQQMSAARFRIFEFYEAAIRQFVLAGVKNGDGNQLVLFCADSQAGFEVTVLEIGDQEHEATALSNSCQKLESTTDGRAFLLRLKR